MFYIEEFLYHLKDMRYSPETIKKYSSLLYQFINQMQSLGFFDVKNISDSEVLAYLGEVRKRKTSDAEYALKVSKLKKYFQYLEKNDFIVISPLNDYKCSKYYTKNYPTLIQKEIENILKKIKIDYPLGLKSKAILELAYSSALRPRELYNLKIMDIDFKKGLLFITQSKNKKDRIVPVGKTALHWIRKYIEEVRPRYLKGKKHGYVFVNHKTGEKLTRWGIRSAIQQSLRICGLQTIKPYSLRSTAATALLLNGMSIAYISALLGHADIRTTQRYLRVKVNALKNELKRSHPRETFGKIQ